MSQFYIEYTGRIVQTKSLMLRFAELSKPKKASVIGFPLLGLAILSSALNNNGLHKSVQITIPENQIVESILTNNAEVKHDIPAFEYEIKEGDNLSSIFTHLGFSYQELMKIMETDLNYLALDTLQPGNTLRFWRADDGQSLQKMELVFGIAHKAVYSLNSDGGYDFDDIKIPGTWQERPLLGEIQGSFSQSAYKLGLNSSEIEQIVSLLKDKLNFARDLRAGDRFEVVQSRQFVDEQLTGDREIEAIKIFTHQGMIAAYLNKDGQYYDGRGESLQKAFRRFPTTKHFRISSPFNPHRVHPVTGRLMPHNGTDFAAPVGTPVLSTGDGVVILTRKHPYAGNYVVIKHDNTYTTRYLHLSKILVRRGQHVKRGEKIALSGSTGRVTGPHLHYELIVRGHPVNAMTAKIPMARSVPKGDMKQFKKRRDELDKMLGDQEQLLAANQKNKANAS